MPEVGKSSSAPATIPPVHKHSSGPLELTMELPGLPPCCGVRTMDVAIHQGGRRGRGVALEEEEEEEGEGRDWVHLVL